MLLVHDLGSAGHHGRSDESYRNLTLLADLDDGAVVVAATLPRDHTVLQEAQVDRRALDERFCCAADAERLQLPLIVPQRVESRIRGRACRLGRIRFGVGLGPRPTAAGEPRAEGQHRQRQTEDPLLRAHFVVPPRPSDDNGQF